jgi:hypothetical protein
MTQPGLIVRHKLRFKGAVTIVRGIDLYHPMIAFQLFTAIAMTAVAGTLAFRYLFGITQELIQFGSERGFYGDFESIFAQRG